MKSLWPKCKKIIIYELQANATPLRASLSLGLGILIGFSPFYGLHIVILVPLAYLFRLNRPLSLLGVSTTVLPVVPFWVAAGIFTGKMTIPIKWCDRIVEWFTGIVTGNGWIVSIETLFRRLLPNALFEKLPLDGHSFATGFVQWALGSCVLAIISALVTVVITYPVFLRISRMRKKMS